jgi:hypothetical protein
MTQNFAIKRPAANGACQFDWDDMQSLFSRACHPSVESDETVSWPTVSKLLKTGYNTPQSICSSPGKEPSSRRPSFTKKAPFRHLEVSKHVSLLYSSEVISSQIKNIKISKKIGHFSIQLDVLEPQASFQIISRDKEQYLVPADLIGIFQNHFKILNRLLSHWEPRVPSFHGFHILQDPYSGNIAEFQEGKKSWKNFLLNSPAVSHIRIICQEDHSIHHFPVSFGFDSFQEFLIKIVPFICT